MVRMMAPCAPTVSGIQNSEDHRCVPVQSSNLSHQSSRGILVRQLDGPVLEHHCTVQGYDSAASGYLCPRARIGGA